MPGTSRTQQKAEARYNVTTQFPQYDLHFAAASGNLGLVEYALSHGQPINSVLNGVLPLHAACAGGSEVVVKYLIDEGADVNAPRIPRRYSNEKHKSSGLAVGASGSTPLHFAAANGHMGVVRLLLARGAVPDRADKHGVTPEMLARENGWVECADVLAAWSGGRAGDLPPVQPGEASGSGAGTGTGYGPGFGNGMGGLERDKERERDGCEIADLIQSGSRRLHMKRSIDNALHLFKAPLALHHHGSQGQLRERERERERTPPSPSSTAHSHSHSFLPSHFHHSQSQTQTQSHAGSPSHSHLHSIFHHAHWHSTSQLQPPGGSGGTMTTTAPISNSGSGASPSPSPSARPLGEYTFYPTTSASPTSMSPSPLDGLPSHRRPSLPQIFDEPASPFQRRLSERRRRPRSAGSDAEQDGSGNGAGSGVNGVQIGGGTPVNGYPGANGANTSANPYININTNTISARKLSSKISLRNLFRRAGGDANVSGSEPGSGSASASTSFSTSSAPIYNHTFSPLIFSPAVPGSRSSASPTPPASPLSTSFTPSPSLTPMTGGGSGGGGAGTWHRTRLGSESTGPVPRSPLVPSAVELHHRYSQEQLHEEFQQEAEPEAEADIDAQVVAPRLSARPSILRGHNRSTSSQSSGGPSGAGTRTLRFEASSASPGPGPNLATAVRLRGTRSASSLRHAESFGYDEEDEEEEEDYGTSIGAPESAPADMMGYEDAELEETTERELAPPAESAGYKYGSAGRARGASFTSTASSSPGGSPENSSAPYEPAEFPFSIERPPLTPLSVTSESSVTTHCSLPEDVPENGNGNGDGEAGEDDTAESRLRGESFSSVETDGSAASRNATRSQSSSASAATSVTTPSPGAHPRTSSVLLGGNGDDTDASRSMNMPTKETTDTVYVHASPSSSLEDLVSPEAEQATKPMTPLDLRGISNLAEAEALVRRAQQAILASASLPADGPESPDVPLSVQLAAYGEILALERRFARGEKQRELWAMRDDDSEGEDARSRLGSGAPGTRMLQSAKEARIAQKRSLRDVSLRQRGATTGAAGHVGLSFRQKGVAKAPKHKRPHTAEGAPQASWSINRAAASPSTSVTRADIAGVESVPHHRPSHVHSHSRSTSTPLYLGKESEKLPDIEIIETTATPVESPKTPESVVTRLSPTRDQDHHHPNSRYTIDDARPSLPLRSRTPDPGPSASASASTDDFSLGVALTRVSTAPLQDTGSALAYGSYGARGSAVRSDPATRRTGGAHKLAKMGFSLDAHRHHHSSHSPHSHHHQSQNQNQNAYSPASSTGSSRSPSKARFGGIKSLVRGLKGKS